MRERIKDTHPTEKPQRERLERKKKFPTSKIQSSPVFYFLSPLTGSLPLDFASFWAWYLGAKKNNLQWPDRVRRQNIELLQ
jgi:hypothetical protein